MFNYTGLVVLCQLLLDRHIMAFKFLVLLDFFAVLFDFFGFGINYILAFFVFDVNTDSFGFFLGLFSNDKLTT